MNKDHVTPLKRPTNAELLQWAIEETPNMVDTDLQGIESSNKKLLAFAKECHPYFAALEIGDIN